MSVTETCSKIYELETYEKAISNPVYSQYRKTAIEKKIQNLENYYTYEYN